MMSDEYPDSDYPWTFYFNGVEMPRYSNCWVDCGAPRLMHEYCSKKWPDPKDLDGAVEMNRFQEVYFRIDHVGTVESMDALGFRIVSLRLLSALLNDEEAVKAHLAGEHRMRVGPPEVVFEAVCDGIFKLNELVVEHGMAFWSAGYEADAERHRDAVRRHKLPPEHPDYYDAPHIKRTRRHEEIALEFLRKDLLQNLDKGHLSKKLRTQLHRLPLRNKAD